MNEDVNTVSPTLGFIIKTIDFEGFVSLSLSDSLQKSVPCVNVGTIDIEEG